MAYSNLTVCQQRENRRDIAGGRAPRHQGDITDADGGTVDATYGADERDVILAEVDRVAELERIFLELGWLSA